MSETIFPRGRVIPSEDVISRNGFVRELEERLFIGGSTMLAGPRRIGKTSVAFEVLHRLRERGCYTVEVDLFHVPSVEEFGLQLMQKVLQVRTGVIRSAAKCIKGFLENLSKSAEFQVKIQDLEIGADLNAVKESPGSVLDEALEIAERIAEKDNKRMVIAFDEWQEVDRIGDGALLKRMRSIFQHQQHVSYLFLGSEPSMMRTLFADRRQAFYGFATLLNLPNISRDEWQEYVYRKFERAEITIDDSAFDYLMRITGGHPYSTMAVLRDVELHARLRNMTHVGLSLLHSSTDETFWQLSGLYDELWARVLEIRTAGKVLVDLAEGRPLYPPCEIEDRSVRRQALRKLVNASVLTRSKQRTYEFVEPMFREWLLARRKL